VTGWPRGSTPEPYFSCTSVATLACSLVFTPHRLCVPGSQEHPGGTRRLSPAAASHRPRQRRLDPTSKGFDVIHVGRATGFLGQSDRPDLAQPLPGSLGRGPSSERHRGIGA
jgi:hypothetical protein